MMRNKHILGFLFLMAVSSSLFAQNKEVKEALKEAQVSFDIEDYFNALPLYRKVLVKDKKNEKAGLNAAVCMIRLNFAVDSLYFLIPNLSASSLIDSKYYLAKIYHEQRHIDDALQQLIAYGKENSKKRMHSDEEVYRFIDICKAAKIFMAKPHRSVIRNMGSEINSAFSDYVPIVSSDEQIIYFTSRREGSSNNKKDVNGNYHEDVYVSYKEKGKWKKAENIGAPINTETNDACVALSHDGQHMIVYRTATDQVHGHLYTTKIGKDNKWEPLQMFGKEVNSQFIETSACFTNDTSEIYFTSNRPGGYGGKDIYRLKHLPNGRWALPFNLGPSVNTAYDDDAPFLHPDGVSLYFSSKGHMNMGEYDVFKSVLNMETDQYSKAENLGYPINDVGNDIFFDISVDGQRAFYSSIKDETFGGNDLYEIDTRFGDNDLKVKHGTAFTNNLPDKVKITLLDNEGNLVTGTFNSNPKTGKFILVMNPLKSYKAIVEREGFTTLVVNLDPLAFETGNKELEFKLDKKAN